MSTPLKDSTTKPSRFKRWILIVGIVLITIAITTITTIDDSTYSESEFYQQSISRIDSLAHVINNQQEDSVKVGWASRNITPKYPVRLTGNSSKPYKQVNDSVYVKVIVLENKFQTIALISYDLWLIHPSLISKVKNKIVESQLPISGTYFTASHTHTGPGGWAEGLLGNLVVGGNDADVVTYIVDQTFKAIQLAYEAKEVSLLAYSETMSKDMVKNRLDDVNGKVDTKLRWLSMKNPTLGTGVYATFSAHAVMVPHRLNILSGDYPSYFTNQLEGDSTIQFAAFGAGTVGSHSPIRNGAFSFEMVNEYSTKLTNYLLQNNDTSNYYTPTSLKFVEWPVSLRSPHFRINNYLRFRPWLFNQVVKPYPASISILKIGNTVMIGLPVEFSGEFYDSLESYYLEHGLSLMITSFNGNYLGYAVPNHYYKNRVHSETREMNWYGEDNGEYFAFLIKEALTLIK